MEKEITQFLNQMFTNQNVIFQKQFESKRNNVALVEINGEQKVLKWFKPSNIKQMETEVSILQSLPSSIHIPTISRIDAENNFFIMEFIPGDNLCDIINNSSISFEEKKEYLMLLAKWFSTFHKETRIDIGFQIKGDAHLRNFILSHNKVWGVDFEESCFGNPSEDIANVCISILTTNPCFTSQKINLSKYFLKTYQNLVPWSLEHYDQTFTSIMNNIIQRREQSHYLNQQYQKNKDKIKSINAIS